MNRLLKQLLVCVLLLALIEQATADSLSDAQSAYAAGHYKKAAKLYMPLAKKGNAEAQFYLGVMYAHGEGMPKNAAKAVEFYRLAAVQGDASAQRLLAVMYNTGLGIAKNNILALMWINIAAENAAEGKGQEGSTKLRELVVKQLTEQQIAEAQELAKKCTASKLKGC